MDFGGGFAAGIAAGMGSGMAIGVPSGQNQTRQRVRDYIEREGMTLQDRFGKPVKVDDFLDDACGTSTVCCSRTKTLAWIGLLLGVAFAAGLLIYLLR